MNKFSPGQISEFQTRLVDWFQKNKRKLPWREKPNWYKTYLSEIMLQQTTVEQGLPYFKKFIDNFPTIIDLANSEEQRILYLWSGLGYYARARNMHKAAKKIRDEFAAEFPRDYKDALSIPGIGPYTAAAILSIAFNKTHAVVDGNVSRVISRIFAISKDIRLSSTQKQITEKAKLLLDPENPGLFNEAMMELGALICTPLKPDCNNCPVNLQCRAQAKNLVNEIPYKSPAKAKKKKFNLVFILRFNNKICLAKRPDTGLLAGMWEFPVKELNAKQFESFGENNLDQNFGIINTGPTVQSPKYRHQYSHIDLTYQAVITDLRDSVVQLSDYYEYKWLNFAELFDYPIHNAHKKILEWLKSVVSG